MLKDMPKNEGAKGKIQEHTGGTKIEPPATKKPTYAEVNIDKKDASKWQNMAENKRGGGMFVIAGVSFLL